MVRPTAPHPASVPVGPAHPASAADHPECAVQSKVGPVLVVVGSILGIALLVVGFLALRTAIIDRPIDSYFLTYEVTSDAGVESVVWTQAPRATVRARRSSRARPVLSSRPSRPRRSWPPGSRPASRRPHR